MLITLKLNDGRIRIRIIISMGNSKMCALCFAYQAHRITHYLHYYEYKIQFTVIKLE